MYKHLNKKIYFFIFFFFFLLLIFYIYFKFYKIKNYPFFELTLIEEHFDIDGYSAFQGIDLLNLYDEKVRVFFATGYAKSFVIFDENSKLFGEPLESDVLDDPELLPAVFAKDLNIIFGHLGEMEKFIYQIQISMILNMKNGYQVLINL